MDSCPEALDTDELSCGCWMALNNWNGFVGPYQDLEEKDRLWDESAPVISDPDYYWKLTHPDRERPLDMVDHQPVQISQNQVLSKTKRGGSIYNVYNSAYLGLRLKHIILILAASVMGCVLVGIFVRYFKEMREHITMTRKADERAPSMGTEYGAL